MQMELSFGEKIKLLRENADLTQRALGDIINMTQRKVSYLEHDMYEPSMEDLKAICQYFNVSADYLLGFRQSLPYPRQK